MSFTGKLNAGVSKLTRSMKNSADNYRLDGKIAEQQKRIKMLTKEIGNLVLIRLEAGDEMSPEIMERYQAIQEAEAEVAELEKDRRVSRIICPNCSAKTSADMEYCGKCGTCIGIQQ